LWLTSYKFSFGDVINGERSKSESAVLDLDLLEIVVLRSLGLNSRAETYMKSPFLNVHVVAVFVT
jgi:hypothetical protein